MLEREGLIKRPPVDVWAALALDPRLKQAMKKLSIQDLRLIIKHAKHYATHWQAIETAPRDGTRILVWDRELERATVVRSTEAYCWTNDDDVALFILPAHWQPLPCDPEAKCTFKTTFDNLGLEPRPDLKF